MSTGVGWQPRRRRGLGPVVLAGWLFADLLLMLALVSMSGQADPLAAPPKGEASGSADPSPSPSPSPSPRPTGPRSVVREYVTIDVAGTSDAAIVRQLRRQTERWEGREAAFVLTFGGDTNGTVYAGQVNGLLGRARPDMFTEGIVTHDFHFLNDPPNTAELWIYFYTSPS
ncbi:hypothetical protein ACTWP5_08980 [Streptomyces sp. 4N509B]|uniref:hypothetical protein n=1 Tax=Streptomyces sp. 4N509B TaxID=3457413 RepID=UPI003FD15181